MGGAPAGRLHAPIDQRRPDRAADIVAAGDDRRPPARDSGRTSARLPPSAARRSPTCPSPIRKCTAMNCHIVDDSPATDIAAPRKAILTPIAATMPKRSVIRPVTHAAEAEAEHGQGEGERHGAARGAEFGLHGRQHHHDRPHADAADRADHQRKASRIQARPESGMKAAGLVRSVGGGVHGAATSPPAALRSSSMARY